MISKDFILQRLDAIEQALVPSRVRFPDSDDWNSIGSHIASALDAVSHLTAIVSKQSEEMLSSALFYEDRDVHAYLRGFHYSLASRLISDSNSQLNPEPAIQQFYADWLAAYENIQQILIEITKPPDQWISLLETLILEDETEDNEDAVDSNYSNCQVPNL
jgi:hypothetical protein